MYQAVTISQIETFLRRVDGDFPVPLSRKQDLSDFARKLREKATLCVAANDAGITAMVAGYTENLTGGMAYVSIAATLPEARGQGLASGLMRRFIRICRDKNIPAIHLYAVPSNTPAMEMYRRMGFVEWKKPDEPRPEDAHLILYLSNEVTK